MIKAIKYSLLIGLLAVLIIIGAGIFMLTVMQAKNEDHDVDYDYINARIEKMMSNPQAMLFSDSGKYIELGKDEYLDIYRLGEKALHALDSIIIEEESKGGRGLRYVLAVQIKQDILCENNFFDRVGENRGGEPEDSGEPVAGEDSGDAAAAVQSLVEEFGGRLKRVSLSAPRDTVSESMQEHYGDLVSPSLLDEWANDPPNAPGRLLSSPWPERIEVLDMVKLSDSAYIVEGEIIEMTSVEMLSGGVAARRPVSLTVERIDQRWLITGCTLGAYKDNASIVYRNIRYGSNFFLPESREGSSAMSSVHGVRFRPGVRSS